MRLRTEIWCQAFIRRCFAENLWAGVVHKGDPDAGVVYVCLDRLHGGCVLYGPAPGGAFDSEGDRRWQAVFGEEGADRAEIAQFIARQRSFDPDIWLIDVETRSGSAPLDGKIEPA